MVCGRRVDETKLEPFAESIGRESRYENRQFLWSRNRRSKGEDGWLEAYQESGIQAKSSAYVSHHLDKSKEVSHSTAKSQTIKNGHQIGEAEGSIKPQAG